NESGDSSPHSKLRLGFRLIKGAREAESTALVASRAERPFRSIQDVARRGRASRAMLARLAAGDAFGSLGLSRRSALWQVLALGEELPLFVDLESDDEPSPPLAHMSLDKHDIADYGAIRLSP